MAAEKEDDFFEQVSKMAERLGLVDEERQEYVHKHMTKAGYTMVPSYIPPEGEEKGSDFFRSARGKSSKSGGSGKSSGWFNE